jgi:hypothetical protein
MFTPSPSVKAGHSGAHLPPQLCGNVNRKIMVHKKRPYVKNN